MQLTPIFTVSIGKNNHCELLPLAKQLFYDNQNLLNISKDGLHTTLQSYNIKQNCAELKNTTAINSIKEIIIKNATLFYEQHGFDIEQLDFEIENFWLNEMQSMSKHTLHMHYGYQISGCFYVDLPNNSNLIRLYNPIKHLERGDAPHKTDTAHNANFYVNYVAEGDIVMWESTLQHEVPPLEFVGIRRSIAFDIKIGRKVLTKGRKMNLQDYVKVYNINNFILCKNIINTMDKHNWTKHSYSNVITGELQTYHDDLDVAYAADDAHTALQNIFMQCVQDYANTIVPNNFTLQDLTPIRYNRYQIGTNMKMHHDHIHTIFDGERKGIPILSILALLNDDFEGGDFLMFDGKKLKLTAGDVIVFPSNFLYPHAVTTITKGTRYSCVSWGY